MLFSSFIFGSSTVFLLLFLTPIQTKSPPEPFQDHCLVGQQQQQPLSILKQDIPLFTIDLDKPAFLRWQEVGQKYKQEILDLQNALISLIEPIFGQKFVKVLEWMLGNLDNRFPPSYADELRGVSNITGVPLGQVVLYNIFYEIFTVCTSIVAQDESGSIFHVRNMDFGIFLGWNRTSHDWLITEKLRRMVINVDFVKNGTLQYKAATFAGYVGIYNAMRPNAYAVTVNERFILNGGYMGIVDWLFKRSKASWMSWMIRDVFESTLDYDTAVEKLSNLPVIAPLYVIISGTKPGEGQIIVRSRDKTDGVVKLNVTNNQSETGWFILETNTDPWQKPIFLDDRRTPGRQCMQKMGRKNVNMDNLLQVLSSPTTLNKLTVFSILIKTDQNQFKSFVQKCPDPCWPW